MKKSHKILLTSSVILNVVLVGVVAGHIVRTAKDAPWSKTHAELAPETRDMMRKMFEEKREKIHAHMAEMRERKQNMEAILSAPEFNAHDFDEAVAHWRDLNDRIINGKIESFKTIMSQLPQSERAKLAPKFVNMLTGHDRKGKYKKKYEAHMKAEQEKSPVVESLSDSTPPENAPVAAPEQETSSPDPH